MMMMMMMMGREDAFFKNMTKPKMTGFGEV